MILGLSEISQTDLTVPFYLSVIVIVRDICIMFTVSLCKFFQVSLQFNPLFSSKINTTIQLIYVVFVLFCRYFSTVMSLIPLVAVIIKIAGSLVAASTIFSAIDYLKHYFWIYDEIKNAIHKEQK